MEKLSRLQTATSSHDCNGCRDPIKKMDQYVRLALPPSPAAFPGLSIPKSEAWSYVDSTWTIEKYHLRCWLRSRRDSRAS